MSDIRTTVGKPAGSNCKRGYHEGEAWIAHDYGSLRASGTVAWTIARIAIITAVLEAVALAAVAPLKTATPYVLTVDRKTGYIQLASKLKTGDALGQDQAVTQSFLVQYVLARETFDATDLRESYRKVLLWSAGDARAQYLHLMQKTTPDSPLNLYTPTTTVAVTAESVSLLSPTTALVRFETTRREADSTAAPPQPWAAVIAFRYSNAPMSMADRFVNPLGFQVTRYRRDAEAQAALMSGRFTVTNPSAPPASKDMTPPAFTTTRTPAGTQQFTQSANEIPPTSDNSLTRSPSAMPNTTDATDPGFAATAESIDAQRIILPARRAAENSHSINIIPDINFTNTPPEP